MPQIRVNNPDGTQVFRVDSDSICILGSVLIGGSNQAQSGSFTDDRLLLGFPNHLVTTLEVNTFIGYRPIVTFSGNTVNWSWPSNNGSAYPRCRFIYYLSGA